MRFTAVAILVAGLVAGSCSPSMQQALLSNPSPAQPAGQAGAQEMLALHNAKRHVHCAPDLVWSDKLAAAAQAWAERCEFAHAPRSVNPSQGENLARGPASLATAAYILDQWYAEEGQYNRATPGFQKGTGHYTQIVWRSTRELGCAVATCGGRHLWVCRYAPAGNIVNPGYFEKNVLPAGCSDPAAAASRR